MSGKLLAGPGRWSGMWFCKALARQCSSTSDALLERAVSLHNGPMIFDRFLASPEVMQVLDERAVTPIDIVVSVRIGWGRDAAAATVA